jgi:hypothetical protein
MPYPESKGPEKENPRYAECIITHQQIHVKNKGEDQEYKQILLIGIDALHQVAKGKYHAQNIGCEKELFCQPGRKKELKEAKCEMAGPVPYNYLIDPEEFPENLRTLQELHDHLGIIEMLRTIQ